MARKYSNKVTYVPYSSEEFDRRISIASQNIEAIESVISSNKSNKAKNRDMRFLLAAIFGLLDESLVSRRQPAQRHVGPLEYIERINRGLSSFFFSSYEEEPELNRRSLALIDCLGNNAEWFLRTKRLKSTTIETAQMQEESTIEVKADQKPEPVVEAKEEEVMETKIKQKTPATPRVTESDVWLAIQREEDFKQLRTEIKSMFPEVIEDPSGIVELANKLGLADLLARVRRSYIFNSKD
jgi:hypothetical protein